MNKRNLIYLGVLIALIAIYAFIARPHGLRREKLSPLFDVDTTAVCAIELYSPHDTLKVVRSGKDWRLTAPVAFPADQKRVHDFLRNVALSKRSSIVLTESRKNYNAYKIADSSAVRVRLYDGKTWREMLFGQMSTVRKPDEKAVYRTSGNLQYFIEPNQSYWRESKIVDLKETDIARLEVTYSRNAYTLSRKDSTWSYQGAGLNFPIYNGNNQLRKALLGLTNLRTQQFVDHNVAEYLALFDQPALSINIVRNDGSITLLRMVQKPDSAGEILLRRDQEADHLFVLSGDRMAGGFMDRFTKGPEHFRQ
jgi:hypothetical protein